MFSLSMGEIVISETWLGMEKAREAVTIGVLIIFKDKFSSIK